MAAKSTKMKPLTFTDIVLNAEAAVIQQAYEARCAVDKLLEERQSLYARIAELEGQVDDVLGESGVFPFPPPPVEVAGFNSKAAPAKRAKTAKKPTPAKPAEPAVPAKSEDAPAPDEGPAAADE